MSVGPELDKGGARVVASSPEAATVLRALMAELGLDRNGGGSDFRRAAIEDERFDGLSVIGSSEVDRFGIVRANVRVVASGGEDGIPVAMVMALVEDPQAAARLERVAESVRHKVEADNALAQERKNRLDLRPTNRPAVRPVLTI